MPIKINKIPQKRLNEIWTQVPPDYYDQGITKNILQRLWHTQKLSQILKLLSDNQYKTVLDIGCSSGILTNRMAKFLPQSKITGLDSYKEAIIFARSKYPHITFIIGDAHKLPFKTKSFDLILCTETLEHLTDPKLALLEMKRVLKKNGKAIISMDSGNYLFKMVWYFWTNTKGKVWQNAHLHEFNVGLLEDLIRKSGFKIKSKNISHLGMAVTFLISPTKT